MKFACVFHSTHLILLHLWIDFETKEKKNDVKNLDVVRLYVCHNQIRYEVERSVNKIIVLCISKRIEKRESFKWISNGMWILLRGRELINPLTRFYVQETPDIQLLMLCFWCYFFIHFFDDWSCIFLAQLLYLTPEIVNVCVCDFVVRVYIFVPPCMRYISQIYNISFEFQSNKLGFTELKWMLVGWLVGVYVWKCVYIFLAYILWQHCEHE